MARSGEGVLLPGNMATSIIVRIIGARGHQ